MNDNKKDLVLTEQEKKDGWYISYCKGNGYKKGCKLPYKKKSWHTPSGCPNCNATFVD